MKLKEFKFSDSNVMNHVARDLKIYKKMNHCLKYLINHLPVNKLSKDNTFDFSKACFILHVPFKHHFS